MIPMLHFLFICCDPLFLIFSIFLSARNPDFCQDLVWMLFHVMLACFPLFPSFFKLCFIVVLGAILAKRAIC